jgi:hypothetical protein
MNSPDTPMSLESPDIHVQTDPLPPRALFKTCSCAAVVKHSLPCKLEILCLHLATANGPRHTYGVCWFWAGIISYRDLSPFSLIFYRPLLLCHSKDGGRSPSSDAVDAICPELKPRPVTVQSEDEQRLAKGRSELGPLPRGAGQAVPWRSESDLVVPARRRL